MIGGLVQGSAGFLPPNLNQAFEFDHDAAQMPLEDSFALATTLADATLVSTAQLVTHAALGGTLADVTVSATDQEKISGLFAVTLGSLTTVSAAATTTHVQEATTLGDVTLVATGTVSGGAISATLAVTLGSLALAAVASGLGSPSQPQQGGILIPRHLRTTSRVRLPKFPPQPLQTIHAEATVKLEGVVLVAEFTLTPSLHELNRRRRAIAEQLLLAA